MMNLTILTNHGDVLELFRSSTAAMAYLRTNILKGENLRQEFESTCKGRMKMILYTSATRHVFWLYEKEVHDNG